MIDPVSWILNEEDLEFFGSLNLANTLIQYNISHVLYAPIQELRDKNRLNIEEKVTVFQESLDRRGIPLIVFPGEIIQLMEESLETLSIPEYLFADLNYHYLLIDLSQVTWNAMIHQWLFDLVRQEIRPILCQPENTPMLEDRELFDFLLEQGCYYMIKAESVIDRRGRQPLVKHWLKESKVQLLGSFSTANEDYVLPQACQQIEKWFGKNCLFDIQMNAKALLNGDPMIDELSITEIKRSWPFFFNDKNVTS